MISRLMRVAITSGNAPSSARATLIQMRRSCTATVISTPSPTPLRPIFQASPTRLVKSAIGSGLVLGTTMIAICDPWASSNAASLSSNTRLPSAPSTPAASVTRASGGTASVPSGRRAAASDKSAVAGAGLGVAPCAESGAAFCVALCCAFFATPVTALIAVPIAVCGAGSPAAARAPRLHAAATTSAAESASARDGDPRSNMAVLLLGAKINRRRVLDRLLVFDRELRLVLVTEHHRREIDRELPHQRVVVLHRLDVAIAGDADAVFRAFELGAQILEARIGLERWIVFADNQQARQRRGHFALRLRKFLQRLGIVHE